MSRRGPRRFKALNATIAAAVEFCGSQARLAKLSGFSQQQISKLANGQRQISAEFAVAIESATDGHVQSGQLRPDLWPIGGEDVVVTISPSACRTYADLYTYTESVGQSS